MSTRLNTVLAAACAAMFAVPALATTFIVPTGKTPTIQSAIELANQNGDEISVQPGVYFEQINFLGKSVHIYSQAGAIATYIDGQSTSGPLVTFHTAENENAILEGFTVRNAPNGAGLSFNGSAPTILSCKIIGNSATNGGGVVAVSSDPVFEDCEIKNNSATNGAGMHLTGGTLTMSNTLLRGNVASRDGGAIHCSSGTALGIDSCNFEDNRVNETDDDVRGGAIWMSDSSLSIANCTFVNNEVHRSLSNNEPGNRESQGGAIWSDNSTATMTNCSFSSNLAYGYSRDEYNNGSGDFYTTAYGGDLYLSDFSNWQVTGCDFADSRATAEGQGAYDNQINRLEARGGSIFITGAAIQMNGCSFTGCSATCSSESYQGGSRADGGAIYSNTNGNPFMQNCSIVGCSAEEGGAIYTYGTASPFMLSVNLTANTASDRGGAIYSDSSYPVITGSIINSNTAPSGGGIYSAGGAPAWPTVSDTLFCANSEGDIAGGWYDDGDVTFSETCGNDCNGNGLPDEYDLLFGYSLDCNSNGVPDECDIADGGDCDGNGIPDACDIADGTYADCDSNGVPDVCDEDCNGNGIPDGCDINDGTAIDCNANGIPDTCDIADSSSVDCDGNGIPDECEPDCDGNGVTDACDIADGTYEDCDGNGVPDVCDPQEDCNDNGVNDACDIANGDSTDNNGNGVPDECECPGDVNGDGFINVNDLISIIGAWGPCFACDEDINGDEVVGVDDLLFVIGNWGGCP